MGEENLTGNEKADPLEKDKIELERFKVLGKIITAAITVLFGSVLVAYINYSFQNRQLTSKESIIPNHICQFTVLNFLYS